MTDIKLCLFASTPDMDDLGFIVKVLTGTFDELAERCVDWGYTGIEFMPDPEHVADPVAVETALNKTGAILPVVNTGRMAPQGLALIHADEAVRRRSIQAFKNMCDFAGHFGARIGLGIARGTGIPGATVEEMDAIAADVFNELAEHAANVGCIIMLEAADPGVTSYINTMEQAMAWVDRIDNPAFSVMLDTYQLVDSEPSIEHGIRAVRGEAKHIHLYDPSRWPPGVLAEGERLDWAHIADVLRSENFSGTGSVVLAPEGDPEPAARKAAAYLTQLFA
ncbi:MAG: sugar phosphate isomerase/epimerase [Chloroflexi bacterium]|nr:MAG: sugar phosphate isomerase/epimerase [Chloroflexota bacterium]